MRSIFSGLKFLFLPSPAVSKLNGIKAKASEKRGALIARSSNDSGITHVIIAKGAVNLPNILNRFGGLKVHIVNNSWPSDCIKHETLLSVDDYLEEGSSSLDKTHEPESTEEKSEANGKEAQNGVTAKRKHDASEDEPPAKSRPPVKADINTGKVLKAHRQAAMGYRSPPYSPQEPMKSNKEGGFDVVEFLKRPPSPVFSAYEGPNKDLIAYFEDQMASRKANGQEFSGLAYKRAIDTLKSLRYPVQTYDQAIKLRGFGQKTAELVEEIRKGRAPQADRKRMRDEAKTLTLFETIYGVGPATARSFLKKGYRTLKDVYDNVDDKRMLISIDHHEDFIERISRTEVEKHYEVVKNVISEQDPRVQCYCMGSYRRGQPDCGDIDIIITRDGASMKQMHKVMVAALDVMFKRGFAKFTFGGGAEEASSTRWLGATAIADVKKWRRMDILCVPWQDLGAAMIYYTGNDIFNRRVRYIASKKGLHLTGNGLYKIVGKDHKELIEGHDEKRIFEILGIPWFEPNERIL